MIRAIKRYFFLLVATAAGAVERVASRVHQKAGIAYILSDIESARAGESVEIVFEDHANPDWVIVRGKRGKATMGIVAARSNVDAVVAEITRMLNETEPRK